MTAATRNVALLVSYDGRGFEGWQRHPGKRTVQGTLEDAVRAAFDVEGTVEGSGRTDRGAHAAGQVATVRLPADVGDDEALERLGDALPDDLVVLGASGVPDGFHARKDAVGKTYRYLIWNDDDLPDEYAGGVWHVHGDLDVEAMAEALPYLEGTHDFASFASSGGFDRASTVRTIARAELFFEPPIVGLVFEADGFLYKMVRNLVRAVVRVGEGKRAPRDVERMLAARDRKAAPGSAPASGLYLDAVRYERPLFDG